MIGQTFVFRNNIYIKECASIASEREGRGPLGGYFDSIMKDDLLGQKSYELAEVQMHKSVMNLLLHKAKAKITDVDCILAGDLLDEITGASFAAREMERPFLGLYNACATFGEALTVGSLGIEAGQFRNIICSTASHFCTAERQYRFPLELGNQRTPLSQRTVTATGAALLTTEKSAVKITTATVGKVIDYNVTDANDMGGAMAPSARDTFFAHLKDTGREPDYYDAIYTGDLGSAGARVFRMLCKEQGVEVEGKHFDCGELIFNSAAQNVQQGGSGAGCNSSVFCSYIFRKLKSGEYKRALLMPTGALVSKTSALQCQTIPGITHAVSFERED